MWGNKAVGEAIQQTGVPIQQGHTYRLSACVRWRAQPSNPTLPAYVRFNVRASNPSNPVVYAGTPPPGSQIGVIGDATNSPITSPQGITSTTWTNVTLGNWTANANYSTITINPENDNTGGGTTVSWGDIDNICLTEILPDFDVTKSCAGKPTGFTANAPGSTSWSWDFGHGGATSTQQNPSYTYPAAGTYNVKLCVNGSTACVTKPVVVNPAPPTPVITGPPSSCGNQTATYSVAAAPGLSYSWNVSNGTINGSSTGPSVSVTWNSSGVGTIAVTVTNKAGCSSMVRREIVDCNVHLQCCRDFSAKTDLKSLTYAGGGVYNFTPQLSINSTIPIVRVVANVLSTSIAYSSASCGTSGPVNASILSAPNVGNFTGTIPVANGDEAIWYGPGATVNGIAFPMQIKIPPPPKGHCSDVVTICIKYTFTNKDCRSCEVIRCYTFKRGGPIRDSADLIDIKVKN
jgi:PKD repeat protein